MAEEHIQTETVTSAQESHHQQSFISPDVTMMLLTWVTFLSLLAILYKFAWKPILQALDDREAAIRKAVDDADKAKAELAKTNATRAQLIAEAENKAKGIITQSRTAAVEAAKIIEQKAREEAQILLENARREIKEETQKAQSILRKESAQIAVSLASKLIDENLSTQKNQEIVNEFIKGI